MRHDFLNLGKLYLTNCNFNIIIDKISKGKHGMKRIILAILLLNCSFLNSFAQNSNSGTIVAGYLNYGLSLDAGNTVHTFGQDILFSSSKGYHVTGLGLRINFRESDYVFFSGYRYSLAFFSFGGNLLFSNENIGISPGIELILPLLIINLKLFVNYNIYFLQDNDPVNSHSFEFGFKIGIIDFYYKMKK